ncbi:HAD-IB family hydrolase [Actinoplanes bogorensis]|uniref:HAD-IB family hydrolase n=1 Tax=Paractinoplanes bogorensis TaxID=1610840 RepID=A0ABS5YX31_9ACTN|nr:HAD-IB family hydrolase [Actinoplanes bogorensis]MBU2668000.1 HAD-IB family hydrolase [Actinoplanes bogorensis]
MRAPLTLVEPPVVLPAEYSQDGTAIAVWDVDRTLVRGDTLLPFLRRFTGAGLLAATMLDAFARSTGPDHRGSAKAVVLQRVLGGRPLAEVQRQARDYVAVEVMRRIRPDSLRRWQWHRTQGHRLVLASASLSFYLQPLAATLGADHLICTGMTVVNGRLTGALAGPNCRGPRKAERVSAYLAGHSADNVWAYGDSRADGPMLALADFPVRVRPYRMLPDLARGAR